MSDETLLRVQRRLRERLFEGPDALRWRPGRQLAAEMLLYLDDPQACWQLAAEWLLELLGADRVDGGYGGFVTPGGVPKNYVVATETLSDRGILLPSVRGLRFDSTDPSLRAIWQQDGVRAIPRVAQDRSLSDSMRRLLASVGTAAKLALPLHDEGSPVGVICADWQREAPAWDAETCRQLTELARVALGPLLALAGRLAASTFENAGVAESPSSRPPAIAGLTQAEEKVARLIAHGLSYKEAARQLDRSVSTVDHQLRSIREKFGVRSTARLVRLLNEQIERRH